MKCILLCYAMQKLKTKEMRSCTDARGEGRSQFSEHLERKSRGQVLCRSNLELPHFMFVMFEEDFLFWAEPAQDFPSGEHRTTCHRSVRVRRNYNPSGTTIISQNQDRP
jgi:hypothetical protein